jgi:predicted lysophospholipase L1 biosynthesis ABC-type transport system permease subunit
MPIEPSVLRRYSPPEPPRRRKPDGVRALIVTGAGLGIILGFFALAWSDPSVAGIFIGGMVIAGMVLLVALAVIGCREDGLQGMVYRLRHPLGTALGADDRPPWTAWAIVLLSIVGVLLAGMLVIRHPEAIPSWIGAPAMPSESR